METKKHDSTQKYIKLIKINTQEALTKSKAFIPLYLLFEDFFLFLPADKPDKKV